MMVNYMHTKVAKILSIFLSFFLLASWQSIAVRVPWRLGFPQQTNILLQHLQIH